MDQRERVDELLKRYGEFSVAVTVTAFDAEDARRVQTLWDAYRSLPESAAVRGEDANLPSDMERARDAWREAAADLGAAVAPTIVECANTAIACAGERARERNGGDVADVLRCSCGKPAGAVGYRCFDCMKEAFRRVNQTDEVVPL